MRKIGSAQEVFASRLVLTKMASCGARPLCLVMNNSAQRLHFKHKEPRRAHGLFTLWHHQKTMGEIRPRRAIHKGVAMLCV
jgi:hypothetical protein